MDFPDAFKLSLASAEPKNYDWTECEVCGSGCVVERDTGEKVLWHEKHECPEPFPREQSQAIWDSLVYPAIVHPRTKARLQMSRRAGYITSCPASFGYPGNR